MKLARGGTPDGVPEIKTWDIELLLAVKRLPWDCRRPDPAAGLRLTAPEVLPEHVLPPPEREPAGPDRDESTSNVMAITARTTTQGHSDECRVRKEQKMLEDVTVEGACKA